MSVVIKNIQQITILGSGKAAWTFGSALAESGLQITGVWSRNQEEAQKLATSLQSQFLDSMHDISNTDLIICMVSDDAIAELSSQLFTVITNRETPIVHISGSKPITDLSPFEHAGVLYPLQTMTKGKTIDWKETPICYYSNHPELNEALEHLAVRISNKTYPLNDQQRALLHLSAVMCNNFTNLWLSEAYAICSTNEINFDLLKPLIQLTTEKALQNDPRNIQTGPALRDDQSVLNLHRSLIHNDQALIELYDLTSRRIQKKAAPKK